ncbi:MAG: hypothetical protein F4W94_07835 [Acidimicrobiia bacterium]|nr:hypothetical protein [Acidimicrobiia bacterium]
MVAPGVVVVTARVVATALGVVVVDDAAAVEDVVETASAAVVDASAGAVEEDGGATVADSVAVAPSPSTPASDVHANAKISKSPQRSPGRLRSGICGFRSVQRHGTVLLTVLLGGGLETDPDRGGRNGSMGAPPVVTPSTRAGYPDGVRSAVALVTDPMAGNLV